MRSHRQGSWSRYLKSTAITASLVLAGCGLKPGESSDDGSQTENDDLSLTKSLLGDGGGILKKPSIPTFACEDVSLPSMNIQYVPPVETRFGPLDVYLGSSSWSPQRIDSLQKAGQSALFGAGLRILGSNGAQSPLSAPWLGIDHITITPALNHQSSPLGNMFGMRLFFDSRRLKANLQKINSDGSVEFEIPLRLDSKSFFIKTPRGSIPALRAKLEKPLSAGSYRLSIFGDKNSSTINLDVRPGDLNNSFSVDAVDHDFIARNRELTLSSVSNQNHLLGLLKADLNSDGRIDQSDLDEFQKLNPEANRISSDFVGVSLTQNPGDISTVLIRGTGWGRGFQGALGTDVGFKLAPANCLRSLPWIGMNQLLIASPGSAPISGLVTLSETSNGKDNVLLSTSLEKLPRLSGFSVLSLRSPLKSGVYQLKISVNNATKALDGILTRVIKFRVLEGDVDGNYVVDRTDLDVLKKYFSQRANNENVRADLNANGIINSADVTIAISRQGMALNDPSIPTARITEFNKVHITDENGNFLQGSISAKIDGQSVAKAELNGQDAALVTVTGAIRSKVLWSNSLTEDTFETILDGKGDYDGRGHYVSFKVQSVPDVPDVQPELPPVTEINKVHINDGNGRLVPGVIAATINGKTVAKVELNGKDAALAQVTGPSGSKVVWINNLSSDTFETTLDGKGDYGQGHYVVFNLISSSEKGGCGRFFGETAGSFPSTRDECFMKQQDIDATCKNFSGQAYKVNWTRFNPDSTVKEVLNLQNGVCQKLPAQPPTYVDNPDSGEPTPNPNPAPAAKVGVGFETGVDMDFNDVYACMPNGQFNVNGREIISARDQTVPIYFGNIASEHNLIIVKAFMSGKLIVERHIALVPRQQSAGKTVLELPKGSTVTFQLRSGIPQADTRRTVIDVNTCRSGS